MLNWNGDKIMRAMHEAQSEGLLSTGEKLVGTAQSQVRVDSGRLRKAIKIQGDTGDQVRQQDYSRSIVVGADEDETGQPVEYAAKQELGPVDPSEKYGYTPYLKPALDKHKQSLAGEITRAFEAKKI